MLPKSFVKFRLTGPLNDFDRNDKNVKCSQYLNIVILFVK